MHRKKYIETKGKIIHNGKITTQTQKRKRTAIDRIWNNQRYAVFVRRQDTWMSPPQHTRSLTTFSFIVSEEASYRFGLRKMESFLSYFFLTRRNTFIYIRSLCVRERRGKKIWKYFRPLALLFTCFYKFRPSKAFLLRWC